MPVTYTGRSSKPWPFANFELERNALKYITQKVQDFEVWLSVHLYLILML